jgi:hypothetical protein
VPLAPGRSPRLNSYDSDDEDAIDDGTAPVSRKRPRSYSSTELNEDQKNLVREKLMATSPNGSFKATVPEVFEFFNANFSSIGKHLNVSTLDDWRRKWKKQEKTAKKKRGPKFVLPAEHMKAMGMMLKAMGDKGSPMNTINARPVLKGYLMQHKLIHLFSETPMPKKISLGQTWILELFDKFNLSDRKGTTDAQHLPHVHLFYFFFLSPPYFLARIGRS